VADDPAEDLLARLSGLRVLAGQHRIALSPDGRYVAYATRQAHGDTSWPEDGFYPTGATGLAMGCAVRVTDTRTGETATALPLSVGRSWRPSWSPDSAALAFYADAGGAVHLHLWRQGCAAARAYPAAVIRCRGFAGDRPRWSPDGSRVYVPVCPEGLERAFIGATDGGAVVLYSGTAAAAGQGSADVRTLWGADIGCIDLQTGGLRRLCTGLPVAEPHVSPDGHWIACHTLARGGPSETCDLYLLSTGGGEPLPVAIGLPGSSQRRHEPAWRPDGGAVAFLRGGRPYVHQVGAERSEPLQAEVQESFDDRYLAWTPDGGSLLLRGRSGTLWRLPARGRAAVRLALPEGHDVTRPLQPSGGDAACVHSDGLLVPGVDARTRAARLLHTPLDGTAATVLWEEDAALTLQAFNNTWHWFGDATADGGTIVYARETAHGPADLWCRTGSAAAHRLTDLNPGLETAVRTQLVDFTLSGGRPARGLLWTPPDRVRPHPTVVVVQPDLAPAADLHRFAPETAAGFEPQYLIACGLAVWMPDIAWPSGPGDRGEGLAADITAATDAVVAAGWADPDRLALAGYGTGAYAIGALLVRTDRFRAVVSTAGIVNFTAYHGRLRAWKGAPDTSAAEQCEALIGAKEGPWADALRYVRNSPLFALDRIRTPMLFIAGREPAPESEAMFAGLCRLGRTAALARYRQEEGEAPFHWRAPAHRDVTWRLAEWLVRWLAG